MEAEPRSGSETTKGLAMITGAAQRIGKAMTEHLAAGGWEVAIHYNRSSQAAEELARHLTERYPRQRFFLFQADLMNVQDTERLLPKVIAKMGKPLLLINNASLFHPNTLIQTSADFFDRHMMVNFKAPFLLMRDFIKLCMEGMIINLLDTRITGNHSGYAAYTLSKKALWELTRMAAVETGPAIRVNGIAPGLSLAPADKGEDYLRNLSKHIPMKRPGGVQPILKSLDYIINNDYLTGQILFCDGGENLV